MKPTDEPPVVKKTFKEINSSAKAALDPEVWRHIEKCKQRTNVDEVISGYRVARAIANDGTYFASVPEITIDKAVLPRTEGHILPTMRPSSLLEETQVLFYDQRSSREFYRGFKFMRRAFA